MEVPRLGIGIMTTVMKHPDYPQGLADGSLDRCECGGIRYWHGEAEGCDDCPCLRFELVKES